MRLYLQWKPIKGGLKARIVHMYREGSKQRCKFIRMATEADLQKTWPRDEDVIPAQDSVIPKTAICYTQPSGLSEKQNIMASLGFSQGVVSNPKADAKIESPVREHIPPTTVSSYLQQRRDQRASEQRYSDNGYWPDD